MPDQSHPWGWDLEVASGGYYYRKAVPRASATAIASMSHSSQSRCLVDWPAPVFVISVHSRRNGSDLVVPPPRAKKARPALLNRRLTAPRPDTPP